MAFRSHLPEPPATGDQPSKGAPPVVEAAPPISGLPDIEITPGHATKSEAAGWMTSLLLHVAILIVVWLLVAPADLGGVNAIVISMSWAEDKAEESATLVAKVETLAPPEPKEAEPAALPDLSNVAVNAMAGGGGGDGNADASPDASGTGSSVGGKASPRGTFFGIEAYGHEFVYVVDMSGSMEGHLYDRAIAELIRSIDKLNPNQKFYVTLFSDGAKSMFDDTSAIPEAISATPENRERLAKWLMDAYDAGGTDPRQAVKLALDMKPSAVFMLSDGEFKERRRRDVGVLMAGDDSTTAAVVRNANATIPIHSIAFENEGSRRNMQELADLSGGTFRFVETDDQSSQITDSLAAIEEATKLGQHSVAQVYWNELIRSIELSSVDEATRNQVIQSISSRGESAINEKKLPGVMLALTSLLEMDPDAKFTFEYQTRLLKQCQELQNKQVVEGDPHALSGVLVAQAKLIRRYPKSKISIALQTTMADELKDQADRFVASNDFAAAFRTYDQIRGLRIEDGIQKEALKQQRMIVAEQIRIAQQKEKAEGTLAFVTYLVDMFGSTGRKWLDFGGREAMKEASMRMHAELRDASGRKALTDRIRLQNEIKTACKVSPEFANAAGDFVRNDRMARGIMNQARRNEQKGQKQLAIKQYQNIVDDYPYSRSIGFARERLASLTGQPLPSSSDETETVESDSSFLDQFNEMFSAKPTQSEPEVTDSKSEAVRPAEEAGSMEWLLEITE